MANVVEPESRKAGRKSSGKACRLALWLVVALALLVGWQRTFSWAVRKGIALAWHKMSSESLAFSVQSARWGRVVLANVVAGPAAEPVLRVDSIEATFSLASLRRGEIEAVAVEGGWTIARSDSAGWDLPVLSLFYSAGTGDVDRVRSDRIPVESVTIRRSRIEISESVHPISTAAEAGAEGETSSEAVALAAAQISSIEIHATAIRDSDGTGVRLQGTAQGDWRGDDVLLLVNGTVRAARSRRISGDASLEGQFNGAAFAAAADLEYRVDDAGQPTAAVTNGMLRLSRVLADSWLPADVFWQGDDLRISDLHGEYGRRWKVEVPGAWAPWQGGFSGRFSSGSHRVAVSSGSPAAVASGAVEGPFKAEIRDGAPVLVHANLDVPALSVRAGPVEFDACVALEVLQEIGPISTDGKMATTLSASVALQPAGSLLSLFRLGEEGFLRIRLEGEASNGHVVLRVATEPRRQEFSWHAGELAVSGTAWLDMAYRDSSGIRGGTLLPSPPGVTFAGGLERGWISGWGGSSSNVVTLARVEASGGASSDASGKWGKLVGDLIVDLGVESPPWVSVPGIAGDVKVTWSAEDGLEFHNPNIVGEIPELAGLRNVSIGSVVIGMEEEGALSVGAEAGFEGSNARVHLSAQGEPRSGAWTVQVAVPGFELGLGDDLQELLKRHLPLPGLTLTGLVGGLVQVRGRTGGAPISTLEVFVTNAVAKTESWQVEGITGRADFLLRRDRLRTTGEQSLSFGAARLGDVAFDGGRIHWQLEPDRVRVSSAELDWLGGTLQAYAVNFDMNNRDTDFVFHVDGVDVGRLLRLVKPLEGSGEGRLYGRMPVRYENGRWKLSTAYLYSLPGREGSIRLSDTRPLVALLAQAGVSRDVRDTLAAALRDFRFTTFGLELHPPDEDGGTLLAVRLMGVSRDKERPTPVNATMNLRGPLETLLNMGVVLSKELD